MEKDREEAMNKKTGVKAHKEFLDKLRAEMKELGRRFEDGTIQDFEKERMEVLSQEIRERERQLKGIP